MTARRHRYGAWQGGPDPLAPPYDVRAAVDAIGAEVLAGGTLGDALRSLLRRGMTTGGGLDELRERARRMRRDALRRGRLDGAVTRAQQLLDQALAAERDALAGRDDDAARFAEAMLEGLPRSTARAVQELADYSWSSAEAARLYQQILDDLRRDVLGQRFAGMKRALADPDAQQATARMVAELNDLLDRHTRGEDTTDQFAEFLRRNGDYFPENPADTEDLVDLLARRAAAGERLMASLAPAQRDELERLMSQALSEGDLGQQMARLTDTLRSLRPGLPWDRGAPMRGQEPLGYRQAADALGEIGELDDLIDALGQQHPGATLDDVDVEAVERVLGRSAADEVGRLRELERELRRQGWVTRAAGRLVLSPKALRRIGNTALRRVFDSVRGRRQGPHDMRDAGSAAEITGASRPWEFGDEQPLDVVRTVTRAVIHGSGVPVPLSVSDFEVVETERSASAAVALCVDLSFSMVWEGRWGPMKQTALALSHLVATRYPQDALQIIGFSRTAAVLSQGELAAADPDGDKGTNLQHALLLAGRHLRRHPAAEPVIMVVTDGEPTAHLDPSGEAVFEWPPSSETILATVREVDRLTRFGATLNLFMLGEDPGLRRFVDAVARRNGGRVFTPSAADLGAYVVSDYLRARRGRSAAGHRNPGSSYRSRPDRAS
jgi:uncharacterized protein with von Willebrand factor type A (vWA) domain